MQIASSDTANIFIMKYSLSYSDPTTGSVVYSTNVSTCGEDVCVNDVSFPSSSLVCPSSIITVTADNGFRQRLLSDPITIGIILCMFNIIILLYINVVGYFAFCVPNMHNEVSHMYRSIIGNGSKLYSS